MGDELKLAVGTWAGILQEIPDQWLIPSWEHAVKSHEWSRSFAVPSILNAYKALILEDRERRERDQYANRYRSDGTLACLTCYDLGYYNVAVYCKSKNDWWMPRFPCNCNATPIAQRRDLVIRPTWGRGNYGEWIPLDASDSIKCLCAYCKASS